MIWSPKALDHVLRRDGKRAPSFFPGLGCQPG
jgi:hypothetical protein